MVQELFTKVVSLTIGKTYKVTFDISNYIQVVLLLTLMLLILYQLQQEHGYITYYTAASQ